MTAQVLLAGGLSGHAKLRGDLRPSNAQADCGVDKDRQFSFSLVSLDSDVLDLLPATQARTIGWLVAAGWAGSRAPDRVDSAVRVWLSAPTCASIGSCVKHAGYDQHAGATDMRQHRKCDLGHITISAEATARTATVFYGRLRTRAVAGERAGGCCTLPALIAQ
jgi:hypothetical protein